MARTRTIEVQPPSLEHSISFREALGVWTKIALNSFGGPAGQIAVMHRFLVEEKRWVSETRFLHALNYCMLLPGPEAQQLAIYTGWLLHGVRGGLAAGLLFILPGFIAILALSALYATYQDTAFVQSLFYGLKPAVMAVVAEAVIRIGKRALRNGTMVGVAMLAFVAIFFFDVAFPLIILGAALAGLVGGKLRPDDFLIQAGHGPVVEDEGFVIKDQAAVGARPGTASTFSTAAVWLFIWLAPVVLLVLLIGPTSVFTTEAVFFSKVAMVTFGGAYSVLAYVAQQAVETYGWLAPGEMLDGLGMAETTPGPLIMVVQFVGFMGAYRNPGVLDPTAAGVLASVLVTWVTFAPCFMWILVGAPYIEYLRGRKTLSTMLSAITSAVVGVILNLAVWFAFHTVFGSVTQVEAYGMQVHIPAWNTVDWIALFLAAGAFLALFHFRVGMMWTLLSSAVLGLAYSLAVGA